MIPLPDGPGDLRSVVELLLERQSEMVERQAVLEAEVRELRGTHAVDSDSAAIVAEPVIEIGSAVTRRGWMKAAAAAAVGGTAVALTGGERAAAAPSTLLLGTTNWNLDGTIVNHTGSGSGQSFLFQTGFDQPLASAYPGALGGWTAEPERPTGVYGFTEVNDPNAYGVVGTTTQKLATGVLASNIGPGGTALRAFGATGVWATASDTGGRFEGNYHGAQVVGGTAALHFSGSGALPPPQRSDGHTCGELEGATSDPGVAIDSLWFCVEDGAPGDWRKLAGKDSSGVLHAIAPVRVYDSRRPVPLPGKIGVGQSRVVDVSDGRSGASGAVIAPDAVPEHARAVAYNLTIVDTVARGFLSVAPGDAVSSETSSINWSASNLVLANAGIVKLDAIRSIKVFCGGTGNQTHFIIDITGYYL